MNTDRHQRRFKGSPYEIGLQHGHELGAKLEDIINCYIRERPPSDRSFNSSKMQKEAMPWLNRLPSRFRLEFEGMAKGADVPLQRIAEWSYIEQFVSRNCSAAMLVMDGDAWVIRNNDSFVPGLWGHMTIREITDRIPTIHFGMEGDVFTATGINQKRLWLHYNFLMPWEIPDRTKDSMPAYVFLTEALETCHDLKDLELLLKSQYRCESMMLFALDGKNGEFAIYECGGTRFVKRTASAAAIAGTNHFCKADGPPLTGGHSSNSRDRYQRLSELLASVDYQTAMDKIPETFIRILADDLVERRDKDFCTVQSNIACPSRGILWNTFGGCPAASKGKWKRVAWPWPDSSS